MFQPVTLGMCVPEQCSAEDVTNIFVNLSKRKFWCKNPWRFHTNQNDFSAGLNRHFACCTYWLLEVQWVSFCDTVEVNPLSANPTKWSKQFVGSLAANFLSVFDLFNFYKMHKMQLSFYQVLYFFKASIPFYGRARSLNFCILKLCIFVIMIERSQSRFS